MYAQFRGVLRSNAFVDQGEPQKCTGQVDEGGLLEALGQVTCRAGWAVERRLKDQCLNQSCVQSTFHLISDLYKSSTHPERFTTKALHRSEVVREGRKSRN